MLSSSKRAALFPCAADRLNQLRALTSSRTSPLWPFLYIQPRLYCAAASTRSAASLNRATTAWPSFFCLSRSRSYGNATPVSLGRGVVEGSAPPETGGDDSVAVGGVVGCCSS